MLEESGTEEPHFSLFPNPATTSFTISINTNFGSGGTIRVFTLGGQLVTEIKIVEEILQGNEININTTDLSEGTYMVELNGTHGSVQRLLQIRN